MNGHSKPPASSAASRTFHTAPATDRNFANAFSYADGNEFDSSSAATLGHVKTDRTRWRLLDERGRQRWRYLRSEEEAKDWPMSTFEKYALGLDTVCPQTSLTQATGRGKTNADTQSRNNPLSQRRRRLSTRCRMVSPSSKPSN